MGYRRGKYRRQLSPRLQHGRRSPGGAALLRLLAALGRWCLRGVSWLLGRRPRAEETSGGAPRRALHPAVAGRVARAHGRAPLPPQRSGPETVLSPPGSGGPAGGGAMPYRRAGRLLSKGERAFWYPLYRAVEGRYRIFCKVRLADVVGVTARGERYWFRKIRGYHVDFVLCDPNTTAPLLVVELDDRSHLSERARARDAFKEEVLRAAGLPVYRVPCQQAYDPVELAERVDAIIRDGRRA